MSALRGRAPAPGAPRTVDVDEATVGRAGDAATRLALEEVLLRQGWRVLYFEDRFGPLFGSRRSKLIDGIAVRLRPGDEEELDVRLIRFESGTVEVPPGVVDRVRRVAASVSAGWIVAAFDGERLSIAPGPGAAFEEAAHVSEPRPRLETPAPAPRPAARGRRGQGRAEADAASLVAAPPRSPTAARAALGAAAAAESGEAAPVSSTPRRRRRSPSAPAADAAAAAPLPQAASRARGGRRRSASPRAQAAQAAAPAPQPQASGEGARRGGRRRGKRGGRRRSRSGS